MLLFIYMGFQAKGSIWWCTGECIDAVSAELTFFTLPNCFELFGFDLMVDDHWHVWLLEVHLALLFSSSCTSIQKADEYVGVR